MKTIFPITILILGLSLSACSSSTPADDDASTVTPSVTEMSPADKLMTNVTLTVPDTKVIVSISSETGPTTEFSDGPVNGTVTLMTDLVEPINDTDYIAPIAVNMGGSGTFIYLATFQPGEASHQMVDSVLLGDRVTVESIDVEADTVTITYMDYGPDQAMAEEPNDEVIKTYTYSNGSLTQVAEQ